MTTCGRAYHAIARRIEYAIQCTTGLGFDASLERDLDGRVREYLESAELGVSRRTVGCLNLSDLKLTDTDRYALFRDDIYVRFVADDTGGEWDNFGRKGRWIPRGSKVYLDRQSQEFLKICDEYYFQRGEGHFFETALQRGVYDFLCPHLKYLIRDTEGRLRGYSVKRGKPLTLFEFERYVSVVLRDLICAVTERTGLYFYDLAFHNVIIGEGQLSIIDLESILPVEWYGQGKAFSIAHLPDLDLGWELQRKWRSPQWYRAFLESTLGDQLESRR